jgi:hypothetical protein
MATSMLCSQAPAPCTLRKNSIRRIGRVASALTEVGDSLNGVSIAVAATSVASSIALPWTVIRVLVRLLTQKPVDAYLSARMCVCNHAVDCSQLKWWHPNR